MGGRADGWVLKITEKKRRKGFVRASHITSNRFRDVILTIFPPPFENCRVFAIPRALSVWLPALYYFHLFVTLGLVLHDWLVTVIPVRYVRRVTLDTGPDRQTIHLVLYNRQKVAVQRVPHHEN